MENTYTVPYQKSLEINDIVFDENKKCILIVEDNKDLLVYLKNELCNDYNIYIAMNGKQAVTKLNSIIEPDIIISDIMMDEMDGYELLNKINENEKYQGIPFIFLTAKGQDKEKQAGLEKGAIDYIIKPFLIEELKAKINALLVYAEKKRKKDYLRVSELIKNEIFEKKENKNKTDLKLDDYGLTDIQKEIIKYIRDGLEYKQIAENLDLSVKTVKKHVELMFKKMNVKNKIELLNKF